MTTSLMTLRSVEDYLGPGESRFFGGGYRRSRHQVTAVEATASGVSAVVDVAYPGDWSTKAHRTDLRPHLSTVDMLVLAVQLAEAHLTHARQLDDSARAMSWLRSMTLRAGTAPEEELAGLAAGATLRSAEPAADAPGMVDSVYDCTVGVMKARCEIRHPAGTANAGTGRFAVLEELLGDAGNRYYGTGFTRQHHDITDVEADLEALRAAATVAVLPVDAAPGGGIDGAYQPSVSIIDCFVVNLQLAQILMYELDGLDRTASNTLWMVRSRLTVARPDRPHDLAARTSTAITAASTVPLRGSTWRQLDIAAAFGGVDLRCSFAHELPTTEGPVNR